MSALCSCNIMLMGLICRTMHCSSRLILSITLIVLVPPCGCVSVLCLALAQRSRRTSAGNTTTAVCLERISDAAVAVAFCTVLAINFFAGHLYRAYLLRHLASSNCSEVNSNNTSWSSTVGLFPSQPPVDMDDRAIRQRFALNADLSVLQSPVDVEFSVLRRNVVNVLPIHRRHTINSSSTYIEP